MDWTGLVTSGDYCLQQGHDLQRGLAAGQSLNLTGAEDRELKERISVSPREIVVPASAEQGGELPRPSLDSHLHALERIVEVRETETSSQARHFRVDRELSQHGGFLLSPLVCTVGWAGCTNLLLAGLSRNWLPEIFHPYRVKQE